VAIGITCGTVFFGSILYGHKLIGFPARAKEGIFEVSQKPFDQTKETQHQLSEMAQKHSGGIVVTTREVVDQLRGKRSE